MLGSEVMDGRVLCIKILSCLLDSARIAAPRPRSCVRRGYCMQVAPFGGPSSMLTIGDGPFAVVSCEALPDASFYYHRSP